MKEKVLILFGGKSVESDISVITALQVMQNLPKQYDFLPVYVDKSGLWWTAENLNDPKIYENFEKNAVKKTQVSLILGENTLLKRKHNKFVNFDKISCVLNCCHGSSGENGAIQGVFECCNLPQTSSNTLSSAICMDKCVMKDVFKANEISSPDYVILKKKEVGNLKKIVGDLTFPLIVKPANLGSSIGITVSHKMEELQDAVDFAFSFDDKVLIEKLVENLREFNCACFVRNGETFVSKVNEVLGKQEIYTFEDKYLCQESKNKEVEKALAKKIQNLTQKVYQLFDCKGVVRIDFLMDNNSGEIYVNEINTIPGSLAFYLFKDVMFKDMLISLIEEAKDEVERGNKLVKVHKSDAVKIFSSIKKIKK